jgi:hypothetical protein
MNKHALVPALASILVISACADRTVSGPTLDVTRAAPAANASAGLQLHPCGFGENAYAAWRAHEGQQDSRGNSDMALYFQKMTATTTEAAGVAEIKGFEGMPLSAITGLSWEHRVDGWCGAGAPRWTFIVSDNSGDRGVIHLGCAAAAHSPGTQPFGWIKDSYPGVSPSLIQPLDETFNALEARISSLLIIFDEGNEFGPTSGFVYLDNITVNGKVFTSPADNGTN